MFSGVADLRKIFEAAKQRRQTGRATILFVDEIHRFNRSQQDGFLPYVKDGTVVWVGATTENPSFELNAALLSRCKVFVLKRLTEDALESIIARAEKLTGRTLPLVPQAREQLKAMADGDGCYLSNMLEALFDLPDRDLANGPLSVEKMMTVVAFFVIINKFALIRRTDVQPASESENAFFFAVFVSVADFTDGNFTQFDFHCFLLSF